MRTLCSLQTWITKSLERYASDLTACENYDNIHCVTTWRFSVAPNSVFSPVRRLGCRRTLPSGACTRWRLHWITCIARSWCIVTSSRRMSSSLTRIAGRWNCQTSEWRGAPALRWSGWAEPSRTRRRNCATLAGRRVCAWTTALTCGPSVCFCSACSPGISPGKKLCRPMPSTRSLCAGSSGGGGPVQCLRSGGVSLTRRSACSAVCCPSSRTAGAPSKMSLATSTTAGCSTRRTGTRPTPRVGTATVAQWWMAVRLS